MAKKPPTAPVVPEPPTKERHFEDAIEHHLLSVAGWERGQAADFDAARGWFPGEILAFWEATQPKTLATLRKHFGTRMEAEALAALERMISSQGLLYVLRKGCGFHGENLRCMYSRPANSLNPELIERYQKNRLRITRQVRFNPGGDESVDVVLSLNGLPIATMELKNPLTRQGFRHAIKQYKDRDPNAPLFLWKQRALVHFAVDPDEVHMTTRLEREKTRFLPFNRGKDHGAGNPEHSSGYRTGYLWHDVLTRDSFLDLVSRFLFVQRDEEEDDRGRIRVTERVVFPRFHQREAVYKLLAAAAIDGAGTNYLIQHSAGSGKSNTIAWLAYRLASLHRDDSSKVFNSVILVTDRVVLDKQLQNTVYQLEPIDGTVKNVDVHSDQLAEALRAGTPIIVTTLQKFPFVAQKVGELPDRRYAVIVDEAHSSQSGESARKLKEVLAARSLEEAAKEDSEGEAEEAARDDTALQLMRVMQSRGRQKNISFFAFTATPKTKTLETFGHRDSDGKPIPFHLYSMKQAIEENFILDVLQNYTTYKVFWKLKQSSGRDPKVSKRHAASQIAKAVSIDPHNIAQKTAVIVEHFRTHVLGLRKIDGRAKAMLVTSSRLHAVRFKQAMDKYVREKGYPLGILVAFSGKVKDPDVEGVHYSEPEMNGGLPESQLTKRFKKPDMHILIAANKYQTGFDQPMLHTMYVDKRLDGVQAVQTLSRLNRTAPGKEDTFVLDFVNNEEDILNAFSPYYKQTTVAQTADPQRLYELQAELDQTRVYLPSEVEAFCRAFFGSGTAPPPKPGTKKDINAQAELYRALDPAIDRFQQLPEEEQDSFRSALGAYVQLYSFLSQVMTFTDVELEKLYTFGRYLELRLPQDPKKAPLPIDGEVHLQYYRLQKMRESRIDLSAAESRPLYGTAEAGTRRGEDTEVPLSQIIDLLNERFGTDFKREDQLFFDQIAEASRRDPSVIQRAKANPFDNFARTMPDYLRRTLLSRLEQNEALASRCISDQEFQRVVFELLIKQVYEGILEDAKEAG